MSDVTGLSFEPPWELVRVEAIVRALSGAAVEKGPQDSDPKKRTITFEYLMQVQVVPLDSSDPGLGNQIRGTLHTNLHDVRLTFRWPLLPDGKTGNNKKSFRSLVSGTLAQQGTNGFFFRPEKYY